jgi:hypothetical protein
MSDEHPPAMPEGITLTCGQDAADVMMSVLDVVMALGVELANRGLIERTEIARRMDWALDQLSRQPINTPARRYPLEAMRAIFAAPVMQGGRGAAKLVPIDGGKAAPPADNAPADPPPDPAA